MSATKELSFNEVTLINPGGDQIRIILSRERLAKFMSGSIVGFVEVNIPSEEGVLPDRNERDSLEMALAINSGLMPGKVEDAARETFTERQFEKLRRALKAGKVVKIEPAPTRK